MLPETHLDVPTKDWTLNEWFGAVGVQSDQQVCDIAAKLATTQDANPWTAPRIAEWRRGRKGRAAGIIEREVALQMLAVLREIAQRNRREILNDANLAAHAEIFLRSRACRQAFALPEGVDDWHIITQARPSSETNVPEDLSLLEVRQSVYPRPPHADDLYGRDDDLKKLRSCFAHSPVIIVDGLPGQGKTALAWAAAVELLETRRFYGVSWYTDKRYMVDLYGRVVKIKAQSANSEGEFLHQVLNNLCERMKWQDLLAKRDAKLVAHCADRLRKGRYLLVVDNLETTEHAEAISHQLHDMLTPLFSNEPIMSAALLTSRPRVDNAHYGQVSLDGIDQKASVQYMRALEKMWHTTKPLSDAQADALAGQIGGNPLMIQVIMRHYTLRPMKSTFEQIMQSLTEPQQQVFANVFQPFLAAMSEDAVMLAQLAAMELATTGEIKYEMLLDKWRNMLVADEQQFGTALRELVRNRILDLSDGGYTMHALIREYLVMQATR